MFNQSFKDFFSMCLQYLAEKCYFLKFMVVLKNWTLTLFLKVCHFFAQKTLSKIRLHCLPPWHVREPNVGFKATCLLLCRLRAQGPSQNLLQTERAAWHTDWSNFQPVESNTAAMRLFSLQSLHHTLFYLTAHHWSDHRRGWCHFLTVARILTSCLSVFQHCPIRC